MTTTLRILTAALVLSILAKPLGFRFNHTASLPIGVYRAVNKEIERGDFVSYCPSLEISELALKRKYLTKGSCPNGTEEMLKQVLGIEGDRISINSKGVSVSDRLIPNTRQLSKDSRGREVKNPNLSKVLSKGEVLLIANQVKNSFDSRYFGPVKLSDIQTVVKPLWVKENG